jgi:hypothetical protein
MVAFLCHGRESLERVWPGVVVEENALNVHISGLRAAPPVTTTPDLSASGSLPARPSIVGLPLYEMSDDVQQLCHDLGVRHMLEARSQAYPTRVGGNW